MNRQKLALSLLLIVLAVSIVVSYFRMPHQKEAPSLKNRPGAPATVLRRGPAPAKGAAVDDSGVHLALLDRAQPSFGGFRRNIFSPIFREEKSPSTLKLPPPPPPPIKLPPPPPPVPVHAPSPPPPPPPTEEQLANQELAKFVFLGFLKKNGEKTVFLSSNNEIFLAKKGSRLGPKYQVSDLTDDAITIKSVAGGRELVIPLLENRALSTRTSKRTP